jgi:hypothetical protein
VAGGGQSAQNSGMGQQGATSGGVNIHGPITVQANDPNQFMNHLDDQANVSGHMVGANSRYAGGRGGSF